jgi:Uncharacterised nucleotidyltransferase
VNAQPNCTDNFWAEQSPEVRLLLACSRTTIDDKWSLRIQQLVNQDLDWDRILYLAGGHGTVPLLHRHLSAPGPIGVPEQTLKHLRDETHRIAGRNVLLATELLTITGLLDRNGISSIPYKGPALACQIYGDLRLRGFIDLDLLIRQKDLTAARNLLIKNGYQPKVEMTAAKERAFLRSECDETFSRDDGKILIELHWAITPPYFSFPIKTEDLFQRASSVELLGRKVPALAIEDLLLILCVNGTKDMWRRLEFICRVSELLQRYPGLDWDETFTRARELRAERMLLLGLFLAQRFLDAPLPSSVFDKIKNEKKLDRLADEVATVLFVRSAEVLSQFELARFRLRTRERLRDRVVYCYRRAFAPTYQDLDILSLPRSLEFLYPFFRPFRLTRR